MSENAMNAEQVAKQAMDLAARAEELARHAHETAGIDTQLAQLEAELGALDAEEAGLIASGYPATEDEDGGGAHDWADQLTERVGSLGDRIGVLVDQVTEAAMRRVDDSLSDEGGAAMVEEHAVDVDDPALVDIDSNGGSVRVTSHATDSVTVTARARRLKDQARLAEVVATERGVSIRAHSPRLWPSRGIRLDVRVPERSELVVNTGGGSVSVDDVHGPAELRTGGGSIRLHGAQDHAKLTTGGGSIELSDFDGSVEANTGGGSITIAARLTGHSTLRTGGGNITVEVADGTNVHVDARGTGSSTDIGGLHSDRGRISGEIGDGSDGTLNARTGGGTIRIIS
jgi:hypothetical protein